MALINDNFIAAGNAIQWPATVNWSWSYPVYPSYPQYFHINCQCAACRPVQVMPYYIIVQPDPKVTELEKRVEELEKRLSKRGKESVR